MFLCRDLLHDFFKPIVPDLATLRTMKRTRAGRRIKQLERLEMKTKEERQRQNKEKQREFFRDLEAHRYVHLSVGLLTLYTPEKIGDLIVINSHSKELHPISFAPALRGEAEVSLSNVYYFSYITYISEHSLLFMV